MSHPKKKKNGKEDDIDYENEENDDKDQTTMT